MILEDRDETTVVKYVGREAAEKERQRALEVRGGGVGGVRGEWYKLSAS